MEHTCPLTGQPCLKSKIYHITEVENNKATVSVSLCEDCFPVYMGEVPIPQQAKQLNLDKNDANKFLKNVMDFVEHEIKQHQTTKFTKKPCPKCKASIEDIVKTGKLGCPNCWDWYAEELKNTIQLSHGTPHSPKELKHTGKKPKNFKVPNEVHENIKMKLVKLKYKMAQATEKENYEEAAQLRDIIQELENRVKKNEPNH